MSRLATRLRQLEHRAACPACADRPCRIEFETPTRLSRHDHSEACPDCGKPVERITIQLAFDSDPPDTAPAAASPQPQRPRAGAISTSSRPRKNDPATNPGATHGKATAQEERSLARKRGPAAVGTK